MSACSPVLVTATARRQHLSSRFRRRLDVCSSDLSLGYVEYAEPIIMMTMIWKRTGMMGRVTGTTDYHVVDKLVALKEVIPYPGSSVILTCEHGTAFHDRMNHVYSFIRLSSVKGLHNVLSACRFIIS